VEGVVIKLYVPCAAKKAKRASRATCIRDVRELTSRGVPLTALNDTAPKIAKTASLEAAQKLASSRWPQPLPKLVLGVTFNDGIEAIAKLTDGQPITAAA
jgi:hypothetical protein